MMCIRKAFTSIKDGDISDRCQRGKKETEKDLQRKNCNAGRVKKLT